MLLTPEREREWVVGRAALYTCLSIRATGGGAATRDAAHVTHIPREVHSRGSTAMLPHYPPGAMRHTGHMAGDLLPGLPGFKAVKTLRARGHA